MIEAGTPALMATIIDKEKVLVLRFSDFYNHSEVNRKYVFPGGRPDEGETLTNALKREVKEETGLDISVLELVHLDVFVNKPNGKIRPIAFYNCEIVGDKRITLSKEHTEHYWLSLDQARILDWIDPCFKRYLNKIVRF